MSDALKQWAFEHDPDAFREIEERPDPDYGDDDE